MPHTVYEYQAFLPADPHDSWSQDRMTVIYSSLGALLQDPAIQLRQSPPWTMEGVKLYRRVAHYSDWNEVT
jgi:hypothetical protein